MRGDIQEATLESGHDTRRGSGHVTMSQGGQATRRCGVRGENTALTLTLTLTRTLRAWVGVVPRATFCDLLRIANSHIRENDSRVVAAELP